MDHTRWYLEHKWELLGMVKILVKTGSNQIEMILPFLFSFYTENM